MSSARDCPFRVRHGRERYPRWSGRGPRGSTDGGSPVHSWRSGLVGGLALVRHVRHRHAGPGGRVGRRDRARAHGAARRPTKETPMIHWILVRPEFSHSVAPMYAIAFATA